MAEKSESCRVGWMASAKDVKSTEECVRCIGKRVLIKNVHIGLNYLKVEIIFQRKTRLARLAKHA